MGLDIYVHGLKMSYEAEPVLSGAEFEVNRGDLVALPQPRRRHGEDSPRVSSQRELVQNAQIGAGIRIHRRMAH